MTSKVGIVNAQLGSVNAVSNMIDSAGFNVEIVSRPEDLSKFSHLILPGVGNFTSAAEKLNAGDWIQSLSRFGKTGKPLLGICLGMQLLGLGSEEGPGPGLGFIDFVSRKLDDQGARRVPNIGWGEVQKTSDHPIYLNWENDARFYFVHTYAVPSETPSCIGQSVHNSNFSSIVAEENLIGVQFHPEKSHRFGRKLFENFLNIE